MNEFLELSKRCETLTVRYDSGSGFVITGRTTSGWTFEVENADLAGSFREASEAIDACVAEE